MPTISLTGDFGAESIGLSSLLRYGSRIWSIGFGLAQPIFDAGRRQAAVEGQEALDREVLAAYQKSIQGAFREVSDALTSRQRYDEQLRSQQQQVNALQQASARILRRYEVGYSSYFEVIDAESTLYAAQLLLVQTRRNGLVAVVQLYKALGGGWDRGVPNA